MQNAQTYLEVIRRRGERRLELHRVYRHLKDRELFLLAYGKLYANTGALTPGTEVGDTIDGMSLRKIDAIIEALNEGRYRWKPAHRIRIPKKNGDTRPLGIPSWSDKLLQEVLRMVLSAYYEPQFSEKSHGFRPGRGCHTALTDIRRHWKGTQWFIEGDIRGCFDHIPHDKLLEVMGRKIKDERLMKLLRGLLDAGYLEDWKYHQTYSGVPQGGVLSPLLTNIFLNEIDTYIEQTLIPQNTRGDRRERNPEFARIEGNRQYAWKTHRLERYRQLTQDRRQIPSVNPNDPNYRRLEYCRYADDFLLGFAGPKHEAETIKQQVADALKALGLELSESKTLITHATDERARFLGYEIYVARCDTKITHGKRAINGHVMFSVPATVPRDWKAKVSKHNKPHHRTNLSIRSDFDIVTTYAVEFQGLVNYYTLAYDVAGKLYPVKYAYRVSLLKTLAHRHKRSVVWAYRRYKRISEEGVTAIVVEVPRKDKKPLVAKFGAKPIHYDSRAIIADEKKVIWPSRNELVRRLLAEECELCGSRQDIEVHHVRKLKDIQRRYQGRPNPPDWAIRLMELRRKTMVVCAKCHHRIHTGTYDGPRLTC